MAKREIHPCFYQILNLIMIFQLFYYVNLPIDNFQVLNQLYSFFSEQFQHISIETIGFTSSFSIILYFYAIFIILYFIIFILCILSSWIKSNKNAFTKETMKYCFTNSLFIALAYMFFIHYYFCSGIAVRGFLLYLNKNTEFMTILSNYSTIIKNLILFVIFTGLSFYLFEIINDIFFHIFELDEKKGGIRRKNIGQFLLVLTRNLFIVFSVFFLDSRFYTYILLGKFCLLLFTLIVIWIELPYQDFQVYIYNIKALFFVIFTSLYNCYLQLTQSHQFIVFYLVFLLFFYFQIENAIVNSVYQKIFKNAIKITNSQEKNTLKANDALEFFSMLQFFFVNNKFSSKREFLANFLHQKHIQFCQKVNCLCGFYNEKSSQSQLETILKIYFEQYYKFYDETKSNLFLDTQKILFQTKVNKNNFDAFFHFRSTICHSISLFSKIMYFYMYFVIESSVLFIDILNITKSSLETEFIPNVYEKMNSFRDLMLEAAIVYQEFLEELNSKNFSKDKISNFLFKIVSLFKKTQTKFENLHKQSPFFLSALYCYYLFTTSILNDEEKALKIYHKIGKIQKYVNLFSLKSINLDSKYGLNSRSTVFITSGNNENLMSILQVYKNYNEMLGYKKEDLIGNTVDVLLPEYIKEAHSYFVHKFFMTSQGNVYNQNKIMPVISKSGCIVPCEMFLRIIPNLSEGIKFVTFITDDLETLKKDCPNPTFFDQKFMNFLIFNEKYEVIGINDTLNSCSLFDSIFEKQNPKKESKESSVYVQDIFPILRTCSELMDKLLENERVILPIRTINDRDEVDLIISLNSEMKAKKIKSPVCLLSDLYNLKLISFDWYLNRKLRLGFLYFFENSKITCQESKKVFDLKKRVFDESDFVKKDLNIDFDEIIDVEKNDKASTNKFQKTVQEQKENYKKSIKPKKTCFVIFCVIFILSIYIGGLLFTYLTEEDYILNFINQYSSGMVSFSNIMYSFNEYMRSSIDLSNYIKNLQSQNLAINISNKSTFDTSLFQSNYYESFLNISKSEAISKKYTFMNQNITGRSNLFDNVINRFYTSTNSSIIQQKSSLFILIKEISTTGLTIGNMNMEDLSLSLKNSTNLLKILNLQSDLKFILLNVIWSFDFQIFDYHIYKKEMIESVINNYFFFRTVFFAAQAFIILFLIFIVGFLIILKKKSTDRLISLFLKIDSDKINEYIQKCETFAQICNVISETDDKKLEIGKLEMNFTKMAKSNEQEFLKDSSKIREIKPKVKHIGETKNLDQSNLRKVKNPLIDKKFVFFIFCLFVFFLLILFHFAFFFSFSVSFRFSMEAMEDLICIKDLNNARSYLEYEDIFGFFPIANATEFTNFQPSISSNAFDVEQILFKNKESIFSVDINENFHLLNKNICLFYDSVIKGSQNPCDQKTFTTIFEQGMEASFVFINTRFQMLKKELSLGADFDILKPQLQDLMSMNSILNIMIDGALQNGIDSIAKVTNQINAIYRVFIGISCAFVVIAVLLIGPFFVRYLQNIEGFFDKTFDLISLKTIIENQKILKEVEFSAMDKN